MRPQHLILTLTILLCFAISCTKPSQKRDFHYSLELVQKIELQGQLVKKIWEIRGWSQTYNAPILDSIDSIYYLPNIDSTLISGTDTLIITFDPNDSLNQVLEFYNDSMNILIDDQYNSSKIFEIEVKNFCSRNFCSDGTTQMTWVFSDNNWTTDHLLQDSFDSLLTSEEMLLNWSTNNPIDTFIQDLQISSSYSCSGNFKAGTDSVILTSANWNHNCAFITSLALKHTSNEKKGWKSVQPISSDCNGALKMSFGSKDFNLYYLK